jgi:hypothetical protein
MLLLCSSSSGKELDGCTELQETKVSPSFSLRYAFALPSLLNRFKTVPYIEGRNEVKICRSVKRKKGKSKYRLNFREAHT